MDSFRQGYITTQQQQQILDINILLQNVTAYNMSEIIGNHLSFLINSLKCNLCASGHIVFQKSFESFKDLSADKLCLRDHALLVTTFKVCLFVHCWKYSTLISGQTSLSLRGDCTKASGIFPHSGSNAWFNMQGPSI